MASVGTYLNFSDNTEEVFNFYQSIFGGEFIGGIRRYGDGPPHDEHPPLPAEKQNKIMHISLPILDGAHVLMGTDALPEFGFKVMMGNHVHISLALDSRQETERLFKALSNGGQVTMELQDMFWGAYYGSCTDKFGVQWMFSFQQKA